MSDLTKERNEMLEAVKAPARKKRQPSNFALTAAIIFSNVVFCLLDVISGITVYWMTGMILYGILTFLAGFVPLVLHEFLFVRAFSSDAQKKIAVTGAVMALLSIILIGILAGYVNVVGLQVDAQNAEIATVVILVLIAAFHAVLTAAYFYIDEGIKADQVTAQRVAEAMRQGEQIKAGAEILELVERMVAQRKSVGARFDEAALQEVLKQLGRDENHDGIPDILQARPRIMNSYAVEAERLPNPNGRHPNEQS